MTVVKISWVVAIDVDGDELCVEFGVEMRARELLIRTFVASTTEYQG